MENLHKYIPGNYFNNVRALKYKREANISKLGNRGITLYLEVKTFTSMVDESFSRLFLVPVIDLNKKIGFVDSKCEIVVEPQFDRIKGSFYNAQNLVAVNKDGQWNVINSKGEPLLDEWTNDIILPSVDSRMVTIGSRTILNVDDKQTRMSFNDAISIGGFRYGFARIHQKSGWGIINDKGEVVLPSIYLEMMDFYDFPKPTTRIRKDDGSDWEIIHLQDLI